MVRREKEYLRVTYPQSVYDEIKVAIGAFCLLYAAYHDMKTRVIPPWIWWVMGIFGLFFYFIEAYASGPELLIMLIPLAGILIEALVERDAVIDARERKVNLPFMALYILSAAAFLYAVAEFWESPLFLISASAVVISILYMGMYYADILHGGADAKALITLSLLFMNYPTIGRLPYISPPPHLSIFLPFSFSVLFVGALAVSLTPFYFLILNLSRGDVAFPEMFLGYRLSVSEAEKKKVWPMLILKDGKIRRSLFPRKNREVSWKDMEEAGISELWVTPKVPFVTYLTLAFLVMITVGNPLFLLFR